MNLRSLTIGSALTAALLAPLLALPALAGAAGHPQTVCQNPRTAECRSFRAMNAFREYAERRWALSQTGPGGLGCQGEAPRWHCALYPEGGGVPASCRITGRVVEVKLGSYDVRHVKATPSCPRRSTR